MNPSRIKATAPLFVLAAVIVGAMALALYWVFLVPIFQAPDEVEHFDYAVNLYTAGRLIRLSEPVHAWNTNKYGRHVYTDYLVRATNTQSLMFKYGVKEPPDYGTRQYYADLDRNAPGEFPGTVDLQPREPWGMSVLYPYGYYAVLAIWMKVVSIFSKRMTVLFFGARIFSVVLLGCSLLLTYGTFRELRFSKWRSVLVTAAVGFFPLTTFVSSYVQADNLSMTLVMLACYLALRFKREPDSILLLVGLALALGLLFVTKHHFYFAVLIPVLCMVIAVQLSRRQRIGVWVRTIAILMAPALILGGVELWVVYGSEAGLAKVNAHFGHTDLITGNTNGGHGELVQAWAQGKMAAARFLVQGLGLAFSNFYLNRHTSLTGSTFQSFWGDFGWMDTPLIIRTPWKTGVIRNFLAVVNVIVFGLVLTRLFQVGLRLLRIARRGRWRRALMVACSNPMLNAYFIFAIFMFCVFALVKGHFGPQGRNWYPFVPAIFMVAMWYAPRALPWKHISNTIGNLVLVGLLLYCAVGSYYAIPSIVDRFYNPNATKVPYGLVVPNEGGPIAPLQPHCNALASFNADHEVELMLGSFLCSVGPESLTL